MQSWHIHIDGMVQGVGFRPYVYRCATEMNVKGTVSNTNNGLSIKVTAEEKILKNFYKELINHPPANAIITHHTAEIIPLLNFNEFNICESETNHFPELMITPDFGICENCLTELFDEKNRRHHYPFITCTKCGPRYSIIKSLPYDRFNTTMAHYEQCWHCKKEYHNPAHSRYYSQTNSCDDCGIPMHLYNKNCDEQSNNYNDILVKINTAFENGQIVAVKGIGGYLLMADATNSITINLLRERKQRPSKPFALLYSSINEAEKDVLLNKKEKEALFSFISPIVLCRLKEKTGTGVCKELIAPGLQKIGVMLPYSPLLALIANQFNKPLIATSGNISGAPIIYKDEDALEYLTDIADFVLTYEREIVVPQDDSVIQYTPVHQQKIILRRARGLAPNLYPIRFIKNNSKMIAMGAELKSSFSLLQNNRCYISQYLGDQSNYDSQLAYKHTLSHLSKLLNFEADVCIADKHPGYFITEFGKSYAAENTIPLMEVQHHEAHFSAVLAENNLIETEVSVLGVVWDGNGYGHDGNIWGGEFFLYHNKRIDRIAHLNYFPHLLGDKMAREPRLAALSISYADKEMVNFLKNKFTTAEWNYYQNQLLNNKQLIYTSSMGRLLDAIACLLDVANTITYEGEAAMRLEALALQCKDPGNDYYEFKMFNNIISWQPLFEELIIDINQNLPKEKIAFKIHLSLARLIESVAINAGVKKIAFSGGVMQNALLVDLLIDTLSDKFELFFHQQLSPNDECISFGQLAYMHHNLKTISNTLKKTEQII